MRKRIIGSYTGEEKGPLIILIGGMHGNEPAGIKAIDLFIKMLEVEPITNVDFKFKGKVVGIHGNLKAINSGMRYIDKDLNRQFTKENVIRVNKAHANELDAEDHELRDLIHEVRHEIKEYHPDQLIILDIHTTSAQGGIFIIPAENMQSEAIATKLEVPVVKGLLKGIFGTTLHYFITENMGVESLGISFEAGQHDDPKSVNRAIAVIVNLMRHLHCIKDTDVENQHNQILSNYSKDLPISTELVYRQSIDPQDDFMMLPGYQNFQKIRKGEQLAVDKNGPIYSPMDSFILMPLYQPQGVDGFFLVK